MKILITAGPIPARLDSVKFITNRFKGGLALRTADYLQSRGHEVTVVHWKYLPLDSHRPIVGTVSMTYIEVEDVKDYYYKVLDVPGVDAYVLAAAVANLMPSNPYEGKFPSHQYKVGEKFDLQFEIAPRVIDEIKVRHPRSTLIGYKLFDGPIEGLIEAGRKTLIESEANLVFANDPSWAKDKKMVLTQDGAVFPVSFEEHLILIDKLVREKWFRTEHYPLMPNLETEDQWIVDNYPKYPVGDRTYGTFAIRKTEGFFTTHRGKRAGPKAVSWVHHVDFANRVVYSSRKATLNAPLLARIFEYNPHINFLIHGHEHIGQLFHPDYQFPGALGDLDNAFRTLAPSFVVQLKHHGYIAGFQTFQECQVFVNEHRDVGVTYGN